MKTVLKFLWYALSVLFGLIGAVFAMGIVEKGMSGLGISVVLICAWLAWAFWRRARRIREGFRSRKSPRAYPEKKDAGTGTSRILIVFRRPASRVGSPAEARRGGRDG